jgi:RNA polymerase sigma-70 factor, ECF subfamily
LSLERSVDSQATDEELMARFRAGAREAFGALVRRYEGELFGYLRRYLGDKELAADVFQNTFLQVFVKADQFEPGRPVKPWLFTIATHQAIDALRRAGRHTAARLDDSTDRGDDAIDEGLGRFLESPSPGPVARLEADERRQLVRDSVAQLPEFLRQTVLLAYFQGLKYGDIAEILGIPVGTVKSRLHTALTRLQETWAAQPALKE